MLEEEEREQHKLDRKIVAEEHWLRYGVTARPQAQRASGMGESAGAAATSATIIAASRRQGQYQPSPRPTSPGALVIEAKSISPRRLASRQDRRRTSRPGSSAPTGSASSARTAAGKTTLLHRC
jgi:ATPase subunit of ABC transporter with duplicated ATPase domains